MVAHQEWSDALTDAWYSVKRFPADLKSNHLHLCSYHELRNVLNDILDGKEATTLNPEVAEWCMNHGLNVEQEPGTAKRITRKETVS